MNSVEIGKKTKKNGRERDKKMQKNRRHDVARAKWSSTGDYPLKHEEIFHIILIIIIINIHYIRHYTLHTIILFTEQYIQTKTKECQVEGPQMNGGLFAVLVKPSQLLLHSITSAHSILYICSCAPFCRSHTITNDV